MATFGVQIEPQFGYTYEEIRGIARACEELDFATLTVSDHLMLSADAIGVPCLECWTVLAALAVDTATVRIGPLVSCASYREPSLLAKVAASVDVQSGGRLEFGLGAGWKEVEYEAYGYRFPPPGERVDRLEESLEIVRRMWGEEAATYEGRYYAVRDALCEPKPLQEGGPPVWVGGYGDRILRVVARLADGINMAQSPTAEEYAERLGVLERACEEVGRNPAEVRKSHFFFPVVAEAAHEEEVIRDFARALQSTEERIRSLGERGYLGEAAGLVDHLQPYVDLGVSHFILGLPKGWEIPAMQGIHDEVMGNL